MALFQRERDARGDREKDFAIEDGFDLAAIFLVSDHIRAAELPGVTIEKSRRKFRAGHFRNDAAGEFARW